MRILVLIMILCGWMQAIDLTVNSDFATTEDTPLVFSYTTLNGMCDADGTRTGFKVMVVSNGTLKIANSLSGPWTTSVTAGTTVFQSGQYLQYTPTTNLNGNNRAMMTVQATDGTNFSPDTGVNIDIAAANDEITAASGTFAPGITEDTQYTFTWQHLKDTLAISEPDSQAWTITITGKRSGTLYTAGGVEITSFPVTLPVFAALSDNALRWTAAENVFTKASEPAIAAFTARAVNTVAPLDQSSEVTFSTRVAGVTDSLAGVRTTMASMDPLVITKGTINTYTYEQLHAMIHGTNDVDRVGTLSMSINNAAVNGTTFVTFNSAGTPIQSGTAPLSFILYIEEGGALHVTPPDSLSAGIINAGWSDLTVSSSTGGSNPLIAVSFDIRAATSGSSSGSASGGGGGGGCGAGGAVAGMIIALSSLLSMRRKPIL